MRQNASHSLHFERLEDRRMLAKADIIFMVDESESGDNNPVQDWIQALVTGDTDGDNTADVASLADELATMQITDIRYGLIGFAEGNQQGTQFRFAHSQLFEPGNDDSLFGNPVELTTAELNIVLDNLAELGGDEDGWDAIEHAIAEYPIRDGAVPVFVLVQNDEGRIGFFPGSPESANETLTHEGVLAALKSKSVILNTFTPGFVLGVESGTLFANEWAPVFELSSYENSPGDFDDRRILGIEADKNDGYKDRQHDYHLIEEGTGDVVTNKPATMSDALQISFNGSNTGATGMVGTGKSILIGQNLSGGIGPTAAGYRAKIVPFDDTDDLRGDGAANSIALSSSTVLGDTENLSGFDFSFFGTHSQFRIHADGVITMDGPDAGTAIQTLGGENVDLSRAATGQTRPGDPTIAVLWDDLDFESGLSEILWKVAGAGTDQRLIIQWNDYEYAADDDTDEDTINFQVVLYADGRVAMNYFDLDSFPQNDADKTVTVTGGISATVGIWKGSADTITLAANKFVPGPHSVFGTSEQFDEELDEYVAGLADSNDSYIRMAWDTGGAAWDVGVIDAYFGNGGITSPEANALRDAFIDSLAAQILRADAAGKVFRTDQVLLALNLGHSTGDINAGAAGNFRRDTGTYTADGGATTVDAHTTTNSVDVSSTDSIPVGTATALEDIFQSVRGEEPSDQNDENVSFRIDMLDIGGTPTPFRNGTYIVELFFAEIDSASIGSRVFDVLLEGKTVLNDYDIFDDHAKIDESFSSIEHNSVAAGVRTGLVKRFEIDVRGNDGLQIDLIRQPNTSYDPLLSAVRIIDNGPPRIEDVIISGSTSEHTPYSFAEAFAQETHEFKTVPVGGADTIEVVFSEWVDVTQGDLLLSGNHTGTTYTSAWNIVDFQFDPNTLTARWRFDDPADQDSDPNPFPSDKLALILSYDSNSFIYDDVGNRLDGQWDYPMGLSDDSPTSFPSGDGPAPDAFVFTFVILRGDYNGDNIVNATDYILWRNNEDETGYESQFGGDGNGDGVVDEIDYQIWVENFGLNFTEWS